jgi:S-adenosyl-L-methionine hydrolase (adenosine-forming)
MKRPIVFCTDYGTADEFVGICHGVIASIAPGVQVIDLTHAVPRQDVFRGALVLGRATSYMPKGCVYLGVVDPGVGSERRSIAVEAATGDVLVGPDNGLLSFAWEALGGARAARAITSDQVVLHPVSRTFHGRDVFAPVAARLATGLPLEALGPEIGVGELRTLELPVPMVTPGAIGARVMGVDGFGNVQLNASPEHLAAAGIADAFRVGGRELRIVGIFAELPEQELGAIVDSQGQLALVVNKGSAASMLDLSEGSSVILEAAEGAGPSGRHLQSVE